MYKHLIKKIIENGKQTDIEYIEYLLDDFIHDLKTENYTKYKSFELDLYKMAYGKHLNEELAFGWVSEMENKDGTKGQHWSVDQTSQYAGEFNKWDWYAVMNMMYSDYYNQKFDTNTYVELAKDWLNDKDVGEGKTLKYYMLVVNC